MTLWAKAKELPNEEFQKVQAMYSVYFPIEVRHYLAHWLESKIWGTTHQTEESLATFVDELVLEIHKHAEHMRLPENFLIKTKLNEAARNIARQHSHAPHQLFAYIKGCLNFELNMLEGGGSQSMYELVEPPEKKYSELINGFQAVRQSVQIVSDDIRHLQAGMENFSLQYDECFKKKVQLNYLPQCPQATMVNNYRETESLLKQQVEEMEAKLNTVALQIKQAVVATVERLRTNIEKLRLLQEHVLDRELFAWRREQQLEGNGVDMRSNLNMIQDWCESLAELIWNTRQQVASVIRSNCTCMLELKQPMLDPQLDEMRKHITGLLSTLVTSTFVIEKQPPQVMKTNTRFTATVRLLVGGQLNVHMTPPRVTVSIISESAAQNLLKADPQDKTMKMPPECGDILNNSGTMEFQPATKQLSVSFRNMQLRKIKRSEKKGTESVMDEKLALFFHSRFKVGGGELDFQVWTLSLPVVVIVHGNQEPHGWATVTWDNAFSKLDRQPFAVPDKVTWGQLAETLCYKFKRVTNGELSKENLRFLAEKIFKCNLTMNNMELNELPVSWTHFCKDALPERNFTFWEWFYNVMKVTKEHLSKFWCDNLIMGFIQKKQAEEILSQCASGTFLLRFSDSELGAITIAWVADNEVFSLQPFTSRDLLLRSLGDRVFDLGDLQILYPDIPKDLAFGKYYTKLENEMQKNGYVKPVLVTTLPPPFMTAQSPDPQRNTPSVQSSCYMSSMAPSEDIMDNDLLQQITGFNPDDFDNFSYLNVNNMDSS